jgi:hypothetical protein
VLKLFKRLNALGGNRNAEAAAEPTTARMMPYFPDLREARGSVLTQDRQVGRFGGF